MVVSRSTGFTVVAERQAVDANLEACVRLIQAAMGLNANTTHLPDLTLQGAFSRGAVSALEGWAEISKLEEDEVDKGQAIFSRVGGEVARSLALTV